MIHVGRQMEIGLSRNDTVKLNRMLMGNQSIFLAMQEENGALGLGEVIDVPEPLVNNY